jgi:hypothetical protein
MCTMKKQRKQSAEESIVLRLWTYAGAVKAVPYFRSMVQSLREAWLELRQAQTRDKLANSKSVVNVNAQLQAKARVRVLPRTRPFD